MFEILNKYINKVSFYFRKGNKLSEVSKDVPNEPGVYYFVRIKENKSEIVYIGASGTVYKNGVFSEQLLNKRLNNQQDKISRQKFFEQKLKEEDIIELQIHWFITYDKNNLDLPGYVEGRLIQKYFSKYKRLPDWNKKFPT